MCLYCKCKVNDMPLLLDMVKPHTCKATHLRVVTTMAYGRHVMQ